MTNHDTSDYDLDWSGVPMETVQQILHQGEMYLSSQLQAALASDQRSTTCASIFIGLSAALLAASLAQWSDGGSGAILHAGLVASAFLLAGAFCYFHAARPVDFYFPGNAPESWFGTRKQGLVVAIGGEVENYQFCISQNEDVLAGNAEWYRLGYRFALVAPIFGVLTFFLSSSLASAGTA